MDIDVFPAKDLDTVFSVLRTALRHSGRLTPRERLFLAGYASITGYTLPETDPIALIAPEVPLSGEHLAKPLIRLLAIAALFTNPVCAGSAQFLRELCWHLDTSDPVVAVVDAVERGRRFRARLLAWLFFRRREDEFASALLGALRSRHGVRIASVSNEIYAAPLETAA